MSAIPGTIQFVVTPQYAETKHGVILEKQITLNGKKKDLTTANIEKIVRIVSEYFLCLEYCKRNVSDPDAFKRFEAVTEQLWNATKEAKILVSSIHS